MGVSTPAAEPVLRLRGQVACGLTWGLVLFAAALALGFDTGEDDVAYPIHGVLFWPDLAIASILAPVGGIVLSRSRHPLGWLLALTSVGFAVTATAMQYALIGGQHPGLPALGLVLHLVPVCWSVGALALMLVMPWMLTHDNPRGRRLGLAWTAAVLSVLVTLPRLLLQIEGAPTNPLAVSWADDLDAALLLLLPAVGVFGLAGVGHLLWRRRHSGEAERHGLGWVIGSMLLAVASFMGFDVGLRVGHPLLAISAAGVFAAVIGLVAAMMVLIARHRLWGLDVAISRATVWGLLSTGVVAGYLALVWAVDALLPLTERTSATLSAALVALLVHPVRSWLQARVDRLVYGTATDAAELMEHLGDNPAGAAGLQSLVDGIRTGLRLRYVEVRRVGHPDGVHASTGDPPAAGEPTVVALRHGTTTIGELRVAPHTGERLDPRSLRLLTQWSAVVAIALELAHLNLVLAASRDHVVQVRHEERRLLRRELHDSLGPALVGIGLGLAAIENSSHSLTPELESLLAQLREELAHRAEEVRTMATSLLPPALDEGRLDDALTVLARRFDQPDFAVAVDADLPLAIDPVRQIAAYHIAAEALLNAHRHSGASTCTIRLRQSTDGALLLQVCDNGRGIPDEVHYGVGLSSMRERAREAGGELTVDHQGGTRVMVRIP